jgi:hypothetical protein
MGKVKVVADVNGNIIAKSKNPEYGYLRVEQDTIQISEKGWLKAVKRSALIKGTIEDFKKAGYEEGTELPGKIVVKESFTPFNPVNPEKNLKRSGPNGVICRVDDEPIYRESFYTNNLLAIDELISHTNTDEIKSAMYKVAESELSL